MAAWSTCHVTSWVGSSYSIITLLSLWALYLVLVKIKYFWFITWPLSQSIRWFCGWCPLILGHYSAELGIHWPCESGDITFFLVTWSLGWCITWLCGWIPLISSHHPTKFGVHRPCESEDITFFICHMTTILKCHVTLWVGSSHPKWPPC